MTQQMTVSRIGKADVILFGKPIGGIERVANRDTYSDEPWVKVIVLEREEGGWFVVGLGADGSGDYVSVPKPKIMAAGESVYGLHGDARDEDEAKGIMVNQAMKWLAWSRLAKELAKRMSWDVVLEHR